VDSAGQELDAENRLIGFLAEFKPWNETPLHPWCSKCMARNSDSRFTANLPLWIIALSLFVIAVCLLLDLVERRMDLRDSHLAAYQENANPSPATGRRGRTFSRSSPRDAITASESAIPEASADIESDNSPRSEMQTTISAGTPTLVAYGGFAPISGTHGSNEFGEIVGRVILRGTPPPEHRIDLSRDPVCAQAHAEPLMTRHYIVSTNGGLANALVFLKDFGTSFSKPTNDIVLQFTNCQIEPYVSAAMEGQRIRFQNEDGRMHRIALKFPGSTKPVPSGGVRLPDGTIEVRMNIRPRTESPPVSLPNSTNLLKIQCVIHPWEMAYVHVLRNPYFAITDTNGEFRIADVPVGNHVLGATHEFATGTNSIQRSLTVLAGQITAANFTINAPRR